MNPCKIAFLGFCLLIFITGCDSHRQFISGAVEQKLEKDTLEITYSLNIKDKEIDSVAFQLLPPHNKYKIYFPADNVIKDSLFRSLGDSLSCCQYICPELLKKTLDIKLDNDTTHCLQCWWSFERSLFWEIIQHNPDFIYELPNYIHDSSLKMSIPCSWENVTVDSNVDTILQADSLLYNSDVNSQVSKERLNRKKYSSTFLSGKLKYSYTDTILPSTYVLKLYDKEKRTRSLYEQGNYLPEILLKCFPRPKIYRHDFEESGSCLGMLFGIGSSKINKSYFTKNVPIDFGYYISLDWGLIYYTPRIKYSMFGSISGTHPEDEDEDAISIDIVNVPRIRIYPFNINENKGLSIISGISNRDYYYQDHELNIDKTSWGLQLGFGFETYFDRLDYIYHLHKDGFHQVDLLIGAIGIKQGKAGVKTSIYFDDEIKSITFQIYMENRIFFETMQAYNSRPLWLQTLLEMGIFVGWLAIS